MSWWVVTTVPSQEVRANAGLVDIGFETWLPMRELVFKTRHMPRPQVRSYPAFPCYLFVHPGDDFPQEEVWHMIRGTEGVRGILEDALGSPGIVTDGQIEAARYHLACDQKRALSDDLWRSDDKAKVSVGPFVGLVGTVRRGRRGSVELTLTLFGREILACVPTGQLERVA